MQVLANMVRTFAKSDVKDEGPPGGGEVGARPEGLGFQHAHFGEWGKGLRVLCSKSCSFKRCSFKRGDTDVDNLVRTVHKQVQTDTNMYKQVPTRTFTNRHK